MKNNLYEIDFRNLEAIYVLAADKYRALELAGDYLKESRLFHPLEEGQYVIRQLDTSVEQILRPERCHECSLNE
jgi:hypothetical protein